MKCYLYGQNIFVYIQRGANHGFVNCAYTSQIDSKTGLLKGKRVGDKFYRENEGCSSSRPQYCFEHFSKIIKGFAKMFSGATERHGA